MHLTKLTNFPAPVRGGKQKKTYSQTTYKEKKYNLKYITKAYTCVNW